MGIRKFEFVVKTQFLCFLVSPKKRFLKQLSVVGSISNNMVYQSHVNLKTSEKLENVFQKFKF